MIDTAFEAMCRAFHQVRSKQGFTTAAWGDLEDRNREQYREAMRAALAAPANSPERRKLADEFERLRVAYKDGWLARNTEAFRAFCFAKSDEISAALRTQRCEGGEAITEATLKSALRTIRQEMGGFDYAACERHIAQKLLDRFAILALSAKASAPAEIPRAHQPINDPRNQDWD